MRAPNQHETERLLSDALSYGDKSKLADALDVSLSEISQQFNPDEPKKSDYYRFKRQLWALAAINPEATRIIFSDLQASVDSWLGATKSSDIGRGVADVLKEAAELGAAQTGSESTRITRRRDLRKSQKAGCVKEGM